MLRSRARQIPLSFHPNTSKVENTTLSLFLLTTCQNLCNSSVGLLFGRSWKLTRKHIISEKKLRHLIQLTTANGLRGTLVVLFNHPPATSMPSKTKFINNLPSIPPAQMCFVSLTDLKEGYSRHLAMGTSGTTSCRKMN